MINIEKIKDELERLKDRRKYLRDNKELNECDCINYAQANGEEALRELKIEHKCNNLAELSSIENLVNVCELIIRCED